MAGPADWYTPAWLLALVVQAIGSIDLDPCADPEKRVPSMLHYTEADDGLHRNWEGIETVFVNPPYAQGLIEQWVHRFLWSYDAREFRRGLLLIPNATDTKWFSWLWSRVDALIFLTGRVAFDAGVGQTVSSNKRGSVLAYCGDQAHTRLACFEGRGKVVVL